MQKKGDLGKPLMKEGVLQVSQFSQCCLQIRLRLFIVTLSLLEISCIGRSHKKECHMERMKSHDKSHEPGIVQCYLCRQCCTKDSCGEHTQVGGGGGCPDEMWDWHLSVCLIASSQALPTITQNSWVMKSWEGRYRLTWLSLSTYIRKCQSGSGYP